MRTERHRRAGLKKEGLWFICLKGTEYLGLGKGLIFDPVIQTRQREDLGATEIASGPSRIRKNKLQLPLHNSIEATSVFLSWEYVGR